jgi:putative hemolysin
MHVSGEDNQCSAAGGHLEFAATASTEECVMPDGRVIEP